jgi:hypothetical protein
LARTSNSVSPFTTTKVTGFGSQTYTLSPLPTNLAGDVPASTIANSSVPGASVSGTTVTITTALANTFQVGNSVVIAGVTDNGYNGTFMIEAILSNTQFQYEDTQTISGNSGGGTATVFVDGPIVVTPSSAPTTVYVDDNWAGTPTGNDPSNDPVGGLVFGTNAFADIPSAISAVAVRARVGCRLTFIRRSNGAPRRPEAPPPPPPPRQRSD